MSVKAFLNQEFQLLVNHFGNVEKFSYTVVRTLKHNLSDFVANVR